MLIKLRNIVLILDLFFIPSCFCLDIINLEDLSDSADISCESNQQCLLARFNDEPSPNDEEEITGDEESDSNSSESLESTLRILVPFLQNDPGTKITFNVREIQSGFQNYGAGYRIDNIPDEAARVKRQIDSTVQVPSNSVVQNNEQFFLNTRDNENNTTNNKSHIGVQNNTLLNSNVLFNNNSVIHEANSSTAAQAKVITNNVQFTNDINSNDSLVTGIASTTPVSEVKNIEDDGNKSNDSANEHISINQQNKNSDNISLSPSTINQVQTLLSKFLNAISSNLHPVSNQPLNNKSSNENSNTPVVVYYTCNCGINEAQKRSDKNLNDIPNTRQSTSTNIENSDGSSNFYEPNIDISTKLAKLSAKGNKHITKKIDEANLSYWKSLFSILSNTSNVELAVDNTNTKPFIMSASSNDRQINQNTVNNKLNISEVNPIANSLKSVNGPSNPSQNNNITSNATQIDQELSKFQTNVNNQAPNQNSPQDQNKQSSISRKRRSIPKNVINTPYQIKNSRKKRQVTGDLNEMIRNTYPFAHHAFHHMDRPFPHHAFHHLNRPPYPHHAFHHLNRPLYFSNHRKTLRHLINSNYWLQTFGEDNTSTEDKPSGYNYNNKDVVEKREAGESKKVKDADESESGIDDDDDDNEGEIDVDSSTSLPKRFNFTVKVSLK